MIGNKIRFVERPNKKESCYDDHSDEVLTLGKVYTVIAESRDYLGTKIVNDNGTSWWVDMIYFEPARVIKNIPKEMI
jgi:hypothetical protein